MSLNGKKIGILLFGIAQLGGCAVVEQDVLESSRYQYDRTFTLDDIAPVIPAYVKLPFPECNKTRLKTQFVVNADINSPREERVYYLKEAPCIVSSSQ